MARIYFSTLLCLVAVCVVLVSSLLFVGAVLPAGQQLSFSFAQGWRSGPWSVYLLDVSRQLSQRLVHSYSIGNPGLPVTWSPDGERITYISYLQFERQETVIYGLADGRSDTLKPNDRGASDFGNVYNAAWSPDGQRIAFTAGATKEDIYVADANGLTRNITEYGEGYAYMAWSPDSRSLAYVNILGGSDITVANVTTGERRNLSRHSGRDILPTWSPDGQQIAFLSTLGGAWYDVYVMDTDGRNVRRLTTDSPLQSATQLAWSADGNYLLYGVSSWGGGSDIFLINVPTATVYNITHDEGRDGWASWSPDGTRIVFESRRDGPWNIYVIDRACVTVEPGCEPQRLTHDAYDSRRPVWSLDGTRVAYMGNPANPWRTWDIFIATVDDPTAAPARVTVSGGRDVHFSPIWRP